MGVISPFGRNDTKDEMIQNSVEEVWDVWWRRFFCQKNKRFLNPIFNGKDGVLRLETTTIAVFFKADWLPRPSGNPLEDGELGYWLLKKKKEKR